MMSLRNLFGDPNAKVVGQLEPLVQEINNLEPRFQDFANGQFSETTLALRKRVQEGASLDELLPEAFALVREAAKRSLGQRHYDVQLMGGIALHQGHIAEMKTGEGKTLTATLAVYVNALTGRGVHVVTVNDYLARRDVAWMGKIYALLGLTCSSLQHQTAFQFDATADDALRPVSRKEAYACDITYGTNNEFGFDYLRDNMVYDLAHKVQRGFAYAIVDEVDSILIDEARTPLIISAPAEESADQYYQFAKLVEQLSENTDYNIDEKMRAATLTAEGIAKMEQWLHVDNLYAQGGMRLVHHAEQALRAYALFKRDRDYVVKYGEVIIIDEFTGRMMQGRRYSEGLHQAIEAKEGVAIQRESQTLATITFQNYFRMYDKLAGMTGTAATEAEEFSKIYNLEVVTVPTHMPVVRKDLPDRVYKNEKGKFEAVVRDIRERYAQGQPVLVGTISIEKNERLAHLLELEGVPHSVLNAKHHEKEAEIIAFAGRKGAVTIATNMAGRGVDIMLGGPEANKDEREEIRNLGGLHVIGTERHESRRIDNQLRGRSGRQGDPGSTQFYVSMEDDLMRIFGSERMRGFMEKLGVPDDVPIEHKIISRSLESAQKKVEGYHFDTRKHLLEYDDVLNKHREVVYGRRNEVLATYAKNEALSRDILAYVEAELEQVVSFHTASERVADWNIKEVYEVAHTIFPIAAPDRLPMDTLRDVPAASTRDKSSEVAARTRLIAHLHKLAEKNYAELRERIARQGRDNGWNATQNLMGTIERDILLRTIDTLWIEHLEAIDHLRTGIGLRGYGQRDPLIEYKKESYQLYHVLMNTIQKEVVYSIFKVGIAVSSAPTLLQRQGVQLSAPAKTMEEGSRRGAEVVVEVAPKDAQGNKIGRNDLCPCGSGKKYKKCHGK
ncbi:MAG: preprotein translocase subunit SecA [Parcubacteria group bacterium CG08_land_8_20_14_0_20_48_21]|nr:MAG: preprotein translocase subunit SecA [Parcubacteria group bacterium CG2_30_48_51]PIS32985.1 MAG: preprotein translocase subunit SecA [Parcubacteria group bacterium CG08_land_8_20_14_0_20_48_21]PIW78902.1 MAG: preprotein translocase subunit SecA [Parcubacteria group bacterium CG_4_8_14_3_um_filter_48_16]PIY77726.1 MAG: preprotein translocase subunit SecA [Parcubacteria group bacterium CG_4_10_14_0_8_um_filter_48_154]PIZ77746.1 MAG: preprotein translocase subunit SecA [bacterium CG_4_10_14